MTRTVFLSTEFVVSTDGGHDQEVHAPDIRTALNRCHLAGGCSAEARSPFPDDPATAEVLAQCESCSRLLLEVVAQDGTRTNDPPWGSDSEGVPLCRECWPDEWSWPESFGPKPESRKESKA